MEGAAAAAATPPVVDLQQQPLEYAPFALALPKLALLSYADTTCWRGRGSAVFCMVSTCFSFSFPPSSPPSSPLVDGLILHLHPPPCKDVVLRLLTGGANQAQALRDRPGLTPAPGSTGQASTHAHTCVGCCTNTGVPVGEEDVVHCFWLLSINKSPGRIMCQQDLSIPNTVEGTHTCVWGMPGCQASTRCAANFTKA